MTIRQRLLYFFAFVTTVFYLSWRILRTIPWDDSLFSIIFGLVSLFHRLQPILLFGISKKIVNLRNR